jgi:hypothetical protein
MEKTSYWKFIVFDLNKPEDDPHENNEKAIIK